MLATLSMSPSINFRDSNSASSPLPLLPRRPSASRRVSPTTPPKNPIQLLVQQPTPPDEPQETENSSSSSSSSAGRTAIRVKRVRGVRPPELSTPIPARRQQSDTEDELHTPRPALVYAPGHLRAVSTSRIPITATTTTTTKHAETETPRIVRKKSGQPIKSSLKSSTAKVRGSLAVVIGGPGSSKSAPSTPTHGTRSVHFDTQLEHVKLFLAEQKPLAVSRDGSPTDDTSGTDGDFPEWIFGRGAPSMPKKGRLEMSVDVPRAVGEVDVKLQSLALTEDETAIAGSVAVRNLAFEKWVAVRFTFDGWQTTSEVTARHARTLPGGAVDVFGFSIRLNDLLARIEGKEMMLAVRYASAGREIWDNNGGGNYLARFRRTPREEEKKEKEKVEDLRERLERVKVQDKKNDEAADKFKTGASLAERYDFGAAARIPWRPSTTTTTTATTTAPPPAPPPPMHTRAQSHPVFDHTPSPPGSTIPWPAQRKTNTTPVPVKATKPSLGSPRDLSEDAAFRPAPYVTSDDSNSDEAPFFAIPRFDHHHHHHHHPAPPEHQQQQGQQRNHQRGYFDVPVWGRDFGTSALRRTPPGTPRLLRSVDDSTPTPVGTPGGGGRFNSFPPLDPASSATRIGLGVGIAFELDGRVLKPVGSSEASTPAFTSSEGTSPMSPADFSDLGEVSVSVEGNVSPSPATTYHTFLDRFCFYTGPEIEGLPRTQSASSVEELLSSPRLQPFPLVPLVKKQRRGSSESTTPLASSRSATPIAA